MHVAEEKFDDHSLADLAPLGPISHYLFITVSDAALHPRLASPTCRNGVTPALQLRGTRSGRRCERGSSLNLEVAAATQLQ
jgi:hypothetical protein